jgi:hypothetical protein
MTTSWSVTFCRQQMALLMNIARIKGVPDDHQRHRYMMYKSSLTGSEE